MNDLNPGALEAAAKKLYDQYGKGHWDAGWEHLHPRIRAEYVSKVEEIVSNYFGASPELQTNSKPNQNFEHEHVYSINHWPTACHTCGAIKEEDPT